MLGPWLPLALRSLAGPLSFVLVASLGASLAAGCTGTTPPDPECSQASECDDGETCTNDACIDGACIHSAQSDGTACTDDGEVCTTDTCVAGACVHAARTDGTACTDDGDFCTGAETCRAGACVGAGSPCSGTTPLCDAVAERCEACASALDCDDDNPCTDDACGNDGTCTSTPNDSNPCDDGEVCNGSETCSAGSCSSDGTPTCLSVATPFCDVGVDACVACLSASDCDDGLFCNGAETCVAGACVPATLAACPGAQACDEPRDLCVECSVSSDCDDSDSCTSDICRAGLCDHAPCPSGTTCTAGACTGCMGSGDCVDGNPCTDDACVGGACSWSPSPALTPCDDGLFCTDGGGVCANGTCLSTAPPTCTDATPICDEDGEQCSACASAADCEDGDACTDDVCNSDGSCVSTPVVCADDGVACTITYCDHALGCRSTSVRDMFLGLEFGQTDTTLTVGGLPESVTSTAELFFCTGPGQCAVQPAPLSLGAGDRFPLPLSFVFANVPELSGGELAVSTASDGSEVCDYVRWSGTGSSAASALGTAAQTAGEWDGAIVDTSAFPGAPPNPGICWSTVWAGGSRADGNDAASDWGYCPFCGNCSDGDPCTYDYCIEATQVCAHDNALREALGAVDFGADSVSLRNTSSDVSEFPLGVGLCPSADAASCSMVVDVLGASGLVVTLTQDLAAPSGEVALVVPSGPGAFVVCDYVRWSDGGTAVSPTALSGMAVTESEWTMGTAVDSSGGATGITHDGPAPNHTASAWSGTP